MEYFGLPVPKLMEGKSMLAQIQDPSVKINDEVYTEFTRYEVDHDGFGGLQVMRAVTSDRYKLVIHLCDTDEFYDMQADPHEIQNLIVLLDSLNKRVQFLNELISLLHLKDAQAVHGRAEDYAKKEEYRGQFDLCVSRAVANLSTLSEYCIPFIKIDGLFISYKSTKIDKEVKEAGTAVSLLGGRIEEKKELILPGSDIPRSFILIRKQRPTPAKFPRKAGLPSKEPLSEKTKPGGKKGKKEKQE